MLSKEKFGKELKIRLLQDLSISDISRWAQSIYWYSNDDYDPELKDILVALNYMDSGPEFEYTYDQLNKFADDLIAGKNVTV